MVASTGMRITIKGPLFGPRANPIFIAGVQAGVQDLTEQGEDHVVSMARIRPAGVFLTVAQAGRKNASKGHYARSISSVVRRLRAVISDGGVVYGPWLEGTSSRNQTTRFKGYAMFRKTRDWMQRHAEGIVDEHVRRAVRKLNGR